MNEMNPFGKESWKVEPGPGFVTLTDYADPARPGELAHMIGAALADGRLSLYLPDGDYCVEAPISLPSHTHLFAGTNALIRFRRGAYDDNAGVHNEEAFRGGPDFYTRCNFNEDICLEGGIWDGGLPEIARSGYHDPSVDGVLFGFTRVRGLSMKKMVIRNSVSYHVRLGQVSDFELCDLSFEDDLPTYCQDGLHFGGGCQDGRVARIYAKPGGMGDDFFAFNADDVTEETIGAAYGLNYGMLGAPIRRILVEDVCGENVYTAARFLSVRSEISDITMRRVRIGYRVHGLNLDAGRYCADPFFKDEDYPRGVGCLRGIRLEDWELWNTGHNGPVYSRELFTWETNGEVLLRNFRRLGENEPDWLNVPTVRFRHTDTLRLTANGETRILPAGEETLLEDSAWDELHVVSGEHFPDEAPHGWLQKKQFKKAKSLEILRHAADYLKGRPRVVCDPYPQYDDRVILALHLLTDMDYLAHYKALDPDAIERMSLKELATMFTFVCRGERFCDGHIAGYIEDGRLYRLVCRCRELLEER